VPDNQTTETDAVIAILEAELRRFAAARRALAELLADPAEEAGLRTDG
jgi:hypothetical protein